MGTTIRRQPITTSIPASPDYKFLNITNFGGIQKSSNPFVVSSNTASDCFNVYVDEDNALSTRPRLNLKYDLLKLTGRFPGAVEKSHVYPVHGGYLLHVFGIEGHVYLYLINETETGIESPRLIEGYIPRSYCHVMEQDGEIYLLCRNGYYKIVNNSECVYVEGYIPTVRIGKNIKKASVDVDSSKPLEIEGEPFESFNLLTTKYKESYFWDGTWSVEDLRQFKNDEIENKYISHNNIDIRATNGSRLAGEIIQPIKLLNNNEDGKKYFLTYTEDLENIYNSKYLILCVDKFGVIIEEETKAVVFSTQPEYDNTMKDRMMCSDNGLTVAYVDNYEKDSAHRYIYVSTRSNVNAEFTTHYSTSPLGTGYDILKSDYDGKYMKMTSDGKMIGFYKKSSKITILYIKDLGQWGWDIKDFTPHIGDYDLQINPDFNYVIMYGELSSEDSTEISNIGWDSAVFADDGSFSWTGSVFKAWDDETESCVSATIKLSNDGYGGAISVKTESNGVFTRSAVWNLEKRIDPETGAIEHIVPGVRKLVSESTTSDKYSNLVFAFDTTDSIIYFQQPTKSIGMIDAKKSVLLTTGLDLNVDLATADINKYTLLGRSKESKGYLVAYTDGFLFESTEPLLIVTRDLRYGDKQLYDEHVKLSNRILHTSVVDRFNNETWFGADNTTYHTQYNDLTYIPMSGYNELGEIYDNITGLSIVNDNVLAVYKKNRIYIISPIVVGDVVTYSYTETKNVIGNDAVGAPILTILTEMPVLVSYDGIYALNQLENVQSGDRITTLISENINPKWLKESSEDIDNCLTMNRLYWTYFILPHKADRYNLKSEYSKIYLLDNRTQQWFYWELPLFCTSAFVKDDRAILVDRLGIMYTLETSDLINEYNSDVTEYYDCVNGHKKLIPWYWHSQILSLNTINYSKRLIDTTFILTDTDTQDEYGLDYSFKAWRKSVSETNATTINSNIHYVQSTTKRTMIPRFNFIQIRLSNTEDDLDNNKLRLVGLGLKYVLLEGLY